MISFNKKYDKEDVLKEKYDIIIKNRDFSYVNNLIRSIN